MVHCRSGRELLISKENGTGMSSRHERKEPAVIVRSEDSICYF
jgi:hypothetical protein